MVGTGGCTKAQESLTSYSLYNYMHCLLLNPERVYRVNAAVALLCSLVPSLQRRDTHSIILRGREGGGGLSLLNFTIRGARAPIAPPFPSSAASVLKKSAVSLC